MTTRHQNRPRPLGPSIGQAARQAKAARSDSPSDIQIRFGNHQPSTNTTTTTTTAKPASILKKPPMADRPCLDRFNESVADWRQPDDLELIPFRSMYSPVGTPPRLRTLMTPPGLEPYRNTYNLRRISSPLPSLNDWHNPPAGLESWGLDPLDYRMSQDLHLIRRHPSPLTQYGLTTGLNRQKKSYIVVPRLNGLLSPPISRDNGTFTMPAYRSSAVNHIPDPQYAYLERVRSHHTSQFQREPSDYVYIRRNEAFANRFVDDFIGKCIEDQYIPDLLLEVIAELDRENKQQGGKSHKPEVDRYFSELNNLIGQKEIDHTHLFSDEWIRELDYQRPAIPSSKIDSNLSLLKHLDFREVPPERTTTRFRYRDLPADAQRHLLADMSQDMIDYEIQNMVTEITGQTINNKLHNVPRMNNATTDIYREIESEVIRDIVRDTAYDVHNSQRHQVNEVQFNAIEKHAQNKLVDTMALDRLISKYIKQNGSVVDVDDLSRFLDATILDNIIYQHQSIRDTRSRTLDNYALRKFHLNAFMNMTLDLLLTELSASLIEDMKDLDEQER